jgi:hypothetical protein
MTGFTEKSGLLEVRQNMESFGIASSSFSVLSVSSVVNSAEFGIDKTAAGQTQRAPIDAAGELAREMGLEKGAGVVGVGESRFDELVVRLVERTLGHGWQALGTERGGSKGGM